MDTRSKAVNNDAGDQVSQSTESAPLLVSNDGFRCCLWASVLLVKLALT